MWADPLAPELPPNWKFLLERGYLREVTFKFTSYGVETMVHMTEQDAEGKTSVTVRSARDAINLLKGSGVLDKYGRVPETLKKIPVPAFEGMPSRAGPAKAGSAQLPKKTLTESDLEVGLPAFQQRCASVGRALTHTTFRGRILSLFTPDVDKVQTIEAWWREAVPAQRLRVLCDGTRFDRICGNEELVKKANSLMPNITCPFRGSLVPQKGKKGESQAESSSTAETSSGDETA
jgi:hypothetical protein